MTLLIELAPEVETKLRRKAVREGQDTGTIAHTILAEALAWEEQDQEEAAAGIERGQRDVESGRERRLAEFVAEQREKHGFAATWPEE